MAAAAVCVCSAEDAGTFTCVAENEAGQDTMDVQLIVHGVSSACIYIRYAFSALTLLAVSYTHLTLPTTPYV